MARKKSESIGGLQMKTYATHILTCGECKTEFEGGGHNKFCAFCSLERKRRAVREWHRKQRA